MTPGSGPQNMAALLAEFQSLISASSIWTTHMSIRLEPSDQWRGIFEDDIQPVK